MISLQAVPPIPPFPPSYLIGNPQSILLAPSLAPAAVSIDWVTVGNPGNAADSTGYGSVAYTYKIGKYEVTNAQYAQFLNAVAKTDTYGLFNANMVNDPRGGIMISGVSGNFTYSVKTNMADKPVNYVSWYDAARFANWLHNGQPTGLQSASTTEGGAYSLTGNTGVTSCPPAAFRTAAGFTESMNRKIQTHQGLEKMVRSRRLF